MKTKATLSFALIMLLISFALAGTASYAWFSVNRDVKATGMSLSSTGPDNLLISTDAIHWAGTANAVNISNEYKIYPSSSSNGRDFFSITDDGNVINGDLGGILNDFDISKLRFKSGLSPVTAASDGYYTSYTIYIKTLGTGNVDIYVAELISNSVPREGGENIDDCIRIAIFQNSVSDENLIGIYDAGAQDIVHPVASISGTTATLYDKDTPSDGEPDDPKAVIGPTGPKITVPGGGTEYVTLVINVWIEGQNHKCVNVIAGDTFQIDLKFDAVQPS